MTIGHWSTRICTRMYTHVRTFQKMYLVAPSGKVETIDARETAPHAATENMFGDNKDLALRGNVYRLPSDNRTKENIEISH